MRDWKKYVREHLPALGLSGAREQEIVEELAQQLDEAYAEALARGASAAEAEAHARAQIPDWDALAKEIRGAEQPITEKMATTVPDHWREAAREEKLRTYRGGNMLADLLQDVRYALRMLRKSPGFTAIVVLTLALGIGANTAIFSVVNAVLLYQLPFPQSGQLMMIHRGEGSSVPYPEFADLQAQATAFQYSALTRRDSFNLTGAGDAERMVGRMISADFFTILGTQPILGRNFRHEEDTLNAAPTVVLSEGLWRRKFAADPQVLGRNIALSGQEYEVIGVFPELPKFFAKVDIYVPIGNWADPAFRKRGAGFGTAVVARLKPGVSIAQSRANLNQVAQNLAATYPKEDKGLEFSVVSFRDSSIGDLPNTLILFSAAVGFVLLIACANVANLLLARSNGRTRELAIRMTMGAGRARVIRQLLTETVLLAVAGGALGLLLATWGMSAMRVIAPAGLLGAEGSGLDARVLGFTLAISVLTGILFGIFPALKTSQPDLQRVLKEGGRGTIGGHGRTQAALIISEIALATVLLVGAGLMIKSLACIWAVAPGFNPHNVLAFSVSLSPSSAKDPAKIRLMYAQLTEKLRATAGASAASPFFGNLPMTGDSDLVFWREDKPRPDNENDMPDTLWYAVNPDYLSALQIPLLRGRFITDRDTDSAPPVAVIDEKMARKLFPGEDPLGKQLHLTFFNEVVEIVGVVGDVKQYGLTSAADDGQYQTYFSFQQVPERLFPLLSSGSRVVVRTAVPPLSLVEPIREQVKALDDQQVMYGVQTMDEVLDESVAFRRFEMTLLNVFAGMALLLACVGIYGVISYLVGQRTNEIGIRMALGAQPGDVLRMVIARGAWLQILGVGLGIVIALPLMRLLSGFLFGVTATDPITFISVAVLLIAVGLLACYIPARRASRVDPLVALRYE